MPTGKQQLFFYYSCLIYSKSNLKTRVYLVYYFMYEVMGLDFARDFHICTSLDGN